MITSLRFPMTFDIPLLLADLDKVVDKNWTAHYNSAAYSGNWKSIALLAAGGKSSNIYALPQQENPVIETEVMENCSYFREVLNSFQCEKVTARLLRLDAGAIVKPHKDHCLGYEDGVFRVHIPIVTNPDVVFILAGKRIVMEAGTCWYIDANHEHSVANRGTENRVHLVIDCNRNAWTDELFFSMAPETAFQSPEAYISDPQMTKRIIEELTRINTPAARELINQLVSEE